MPDDPPIPTRRRRRGVPVSLRGPAFSAKSAEVQEKRLEALELRKAGASYPQIAKQMGLSTPMQAWRYVNDAIAAIPEDKAREVKAIELAKCDASEVRLNNQHAKTKTVLEVCRIEIALVRVRERRARMLGLDAPTRNEHTGKDGAPLMSLTMDQIQGMTDEQLERAIAAGRRSGPGGGGAGATAQAPRAPRQAH